MATIDTRQVLAEALHEAHCVLRAQELLHQDSNNVVIADCFASLQDDLLHFVEHMVQELNHAGDQQTTVNNLLATKPQTSYRPLQGGDDYLHQTSTN